MSVTVSLFDPLGLFSTAPLRVFEPQKELSLRGHSTDDGVKLRTGKNSVTLQGHSLGPERRGLGPLEYLEPRGISVGLDADKAVTLTTRPGWTALECARRLAEKVNARSGFRATVESGLEGTATLHFTRR